MKSCYIICGGPESCFNVKIPDDAFVICADSGYDKAKKAGITPCLIVGDFDSINSSLPEEIDIVKAPTHKDDTDTMLAVRMAIEKDYKEIVLVSAFGGRFDHSFANIQTIQYVKSQNIKCYAIGDDTDAYICGAGEKAVISPYSDRYLSVFSLTEKSVVTIENAEYRLNKSEITNTFPIGVSNEFTDKECVIKEDSGMLLVLCVKK